MKTLALLFSFLPAVALAAPQKSPPPRAGAAGPDDAQRAAFMQKRMRLARTLGLAEALDLDDAAALRLRDTMARFDERRAPLQKEIRGDMQLLRDAARGDKAAGAQVDSAIKRLRDARAKVQSLKGEMFTEITHGLSPERKARAALFLARFHERAGMMMPHSSCPLMHRHGMGMGPGPVGGMQGGMGMGPGPRGAPPAGPMDNAADDGMDD